MAFAFAICMGVIITFLFLVAGDVPVYCVEFRGARVCFLSKRRAEKYYGLLEEMVAVEKDIQETYRKLKETEYENA